MDNTKFQELVRVIDATLFELNKQKGINGHNSLEIIKFLINFDGIDNLISSDFKNYIVDQIKECNDKENVRKEIKNILMYPENKYPPWNNITLTNNVTEEINNFIKNVEFKNKNYRW